jgi:hypothetical protein
VSSGLARGKAEMSKMFDDEALLIARNLLFEQGVIANSKKACTLIRAGMMNSYMRSSTLVISIPWRNSEHP